MPINPFNDNDKLPACARLGSSWTEGYEVEITMTAAGNEHRALVHPFPARRTTVFYTNTRDSISAEITNFFHRMNGRFIGFRVEAYDDYSTNGMDGVPTLTDQVCEVVTAGTWQIMKKYGATGGKRTIWKPRSGTVLVGVAGKATAAVVDYTTGRFTITAKTATITGITINTQAVLTVNAGHGAVAGESFYISGVAGMTQINGKRGTILVSGATSITLALSTVGYSAYTSGGTATTTPQTGEAVTAGCLYDIPCRFDSDLTITPMADNIDYADTNQLDILELLNP